MLTKKYGEEGLKIHSKPGRVWPSDDDGDLSDFHYVLVMMMIRYSIWPSVPNIEIRH